MASGISYENYKITARDRYRKIRGGNKDVSFSYLANYVVVDLDKRELAISVDGHFNDMVDKLEGNKELRRKNHRHIYLPYADEVCVSPIGEQIIEFCETDFKESMSDAMLMLNFIEALKADTPEAKAIREKHGFDDPQPVVSKPTSDEELDMIYYENYERLATSAGGVISSNLYVNIFPPLIHNASYEMYKAYFRYILALQKEYQLLLDFCFNTDFYAEELEGITAASRFHLYCSTTDALPMRSMSMSFRFSRSGFGNVSTPVRDKEAYEELKKNPGKTLGSISKRKPNAFERKFNIPTAATDLARVLPVPILSSYKCSSLEEILYLEFEKMLELDIRIKKCKNCGRYFILKGNYQTEYCARVKKGEAQNCQSLGATAKYAQKVKENPALTIFNRAYKRYHARVKVGSVKPDAFKKWRYEAVVMRDKCLSGEMPVSEFEDWINNYFG